MFRVHEPQPEQLRTHLQHLTREQLTYPQAGATRAETQPAGYVHDRYHVELGPGNFDRAVAALRAWQAHTGAGVSVFPRDAPIEDDTDVIVTARAGPLYALAPCRIVYVIDETDRFGFAYGTLPGHPECGEEAFIIERDANDNVRFSIVAFSRPAELLARLGRPIARRIQRHTIRAYLEALRQAAG